MRVVSNQPAWLELNLVAFNPGIRAEIVKQMKENIELLHDLGGKVLDIFPGRREGLVPPRMETAWALAKEIISACVEDAERYGVTLAIETVPRGFIETGEQAARMAEEIGSIAVGVCVDVANANAVQSPVAALEEAKGRLALVHLSDSVRGKHVHSPIGEGNIDFAAVARKLREIGYDGVSILEVMTRDNVDEAYLQSKIRLEELGWQS
jgi:deoxyribonuclease-4